MFAKLAFRNVKRQIGNYLIYFITVTLTIALMFAFDNIIFNEQLRHYADYYSELRKGLIAMVVFVALIVAFVLGYATSFMLKLRKREFGTYLTMGMTRKNILTIFIIETMILCLAALGLGSLAGLFLYQGAMMVMTSLMEMEFAFAAYSLPGMVFTVLLVLGIVLLASFTSAVYLKRVSIYNLIHSNEKVEKHVKYPGLWLTVMLVSLGTFVGSCTVFYLEIKKAYFGQTKISVILLCLGTLAVTIVLFHTAMARSVVNLMLKNRQFCTKETNAFTLRQLSGKLRSNSVMAGILAFLISFAVIGANVSFIQKVIANASLNKNYPFDISAALDMENSTPPVDFQEAKKIINTYTRIESSIPYTIYTTGSNYLYTFTPWSGKGYEGNKDSLIALSDYNRLLAALGKPAVRLNGSFRIVTNIPQAETCDFSKAELKLNGKHYRYEGNCEEAPLAAYAHFSAVVPDEAVKGEAVLTECMAIDVRDGKYDANGLRKALSYKYTTDTYTYDRCDYLIKEYARLQNNSGSAIFVVGALYISVIFVFMAMAILALKTLSGLSEDRQRYGILFRLGAGSREQGKTLFRQTFSFFFLPFALPILLSIPTAYICGEIMKLSSYGMLIGRTYLNCTVISLTLIAVYTLYFAATYLIARRNIIGGSQ